MEEDREEWRPIKGFGGRYEVSSLGRVRSSYKRVGFDGIIAQRKKAGNSYMSVDLQFKGNRKTFNTHRLVAEAFIPNPDNKGDVNHINGVKWDNRVENLEWATRPENMKHSQEVLGRGGRQKRAIKCLETGVIYDCIAGASRKTKINKYGLWNALNGRAYTAGGFHWEYAD